MLSFGNTKRFARSYRARQNAFRPLINDFGVQCSLLGGTHYSCLPACCVEERPDPVSLADFAGQALLTAAIHRAFPADDIVGEEVADTLRHDAKMRVRG